MTTSPTLRPIDIADAIISQSEASAEALLSQGWEGAGSSYSLGAYLGDDEALADLLGRPTTLDERTRLETAIRERLTAAARTSPGPVLISYEVSLSDGPDAMPIRLSSPILCF